MRNLLKLGSRKGQASFEYVILFGIFIGVLAIVIFYVTNQVDTYIMSFEIEDATKTMTRTIDQIYAIGPGTRKLVVLEMPRSVEQGYISENEINYQVRSETGKLSDVHFLTKPKIVGFFQIGQGVKHYVLQVEDNGYVSINPISRYNLTNNLELYLNFNSKNSTHVKNLVSSDHNGIFFGNIDCNSEGYIGYACLFDGVDDNISIPNHADLQITGDLTITAWVKPTSLASRHSVVHKSFNNEYEVMVESNRSVSFFQGDGTWEAPATPLEMRVTNNTWNHIAITRTLEDMKVRYYLNGEYKGYANITKIPTASSDDVSIGQRPLSTYRFKGMIDEVMIFKVALNDEEIRSLYGYGRNANLD